MYIIIILYFMDNKLFAINVIIYDMINDIYK